MLGFLHFNTNKLFNKKVIERVKTFSNIMSVESKYTKCNQTHSILLFLPC
jgi:hypothetical protein